MKIRVLVLCATVLLLQGCPLPQTQSCTLTTHTVSTRVAVTSIGTPSRLFEVTARGFHPNAQARLAVHQFPKREDINVVVNFDAGGSLRWTTDAPLLLPTDPTFDPNVDVTTTLIETPSNCIATSSIKERAFGL